MGEADANWDPMSEAYHSAEVNAYNMKCPSRQFGEENLCLFVSGFPSTVTSHAVRNLLSEAGQIQYVKTVPDRKKWNQTIAYVYAASYKDALAIIGGFNNFSFQNSSLRIGFATKRKNLTDPAGQGNVRSAVETRGSLSGLNQTLSDVESLGARPGKADVMDFQRLGPQQSQQRPPMGRAKLLMSLTSDEVKTPTIGHGVGRKSWSQPSAAAPPDRRCALPDEMDAAAAAADVGDNARLQSNEYCDQLKQLSSPPDAKRKDEEDKTKTRGPQSVSSKGLLQNEHQVDNASASSVPSAKKSPDLCAFCQNPGQLLCSVCKTTYCSQSCQRIDWPHHKNVCQSKRTKSDSATNFADYENEFLVGVDVDDLSSSLEINLPDGKKFATPHMKLTESSLPVDACTEVVLVTAPVSPSEIWVVEAKHSKLLDNIKNSLRKHYSSVQNAQRSSSSVQLMLNDYCVCLFSVDGCWYRTRVESVNRDGTFDVRYVDYGNTETVPSSRIDVLEEEFCSVPSLAVRCRLSDLVPADGSGVWSHRALKLCSDLLPILQVLNVKCIQKTTNVHSIELVNAAGKRISDEFLEARVAKHLSESTKLPLNDKAQEEKISPTSCKEDELKVSLSPLPLSPSGSEIVKEIVVTSPHGMPTASKHLFRGAKVLVKVLNLISPTQFWVHIVSPGSNDLEKLTELEASMKEHYEKKPSKKGFSLTARMLYAAKCSLTGRWLRVHVLNFDRSGVEAFLLDYGVCQAMSLVSLISLEGQFCSLPFQAVQCTLAGIGPKPGSTAWTQETVTYLQRLIDHPSNTEHLEAAVCRVDGSCGHLELILPCGETINNLLVKYGMAEFVPDLQPGFFVLSRNLVSGGKAFSEGRGASHTSPLNLQVSPADRSIGEPVEGLLKKLDAAPPVHPPISSATPKLKDLVRCPLAKDKIHEVIVTDAKHFFGFYVQVVTVDKATELQTLEEKINEIYGGYRGSFRPSVGDIVAARFSVDEKWYRGLVREVTSPDSALVMFLDYGNCDNVAMRFISPLDASLLTVPVFAYRCALLEPTGVVFVQPWNEDFLLPLSATFQMKVVNEKENVHVVELFSKDLNINWKDKLLRDGVIQLKLTSAVDTSKPSSSSAGHSVSSSLGERVATTSVAGNLRPKFDVGSAVCVVHINGVTDFYVHVTDKDLEKRFHDLMQRLKDECDKCALSSYVPKGPGEIVAALYDHIWYRAKVLQMTSSTACRMEFVDFGNVDLVACSCLRPLPSGCQLDVLSEMAVPCCLFNLCAASPKGGSGDCLDVESSKWFRKMCLEKQFTVAGMCNVVSNRYALDLRSTEMSGTVRDCYLKMFIDQKVPPLAESTTAGKPQADRHPVAQVASSSPYEQQPRAPPLASSSAQRPSDKRVHFANDSRAPPNAQSSGNQLGATGSVQSGLRSTSNDQSNFKSIGSQQYGSKSTGYQQEGGRSTGYHQEGGRSTGYHQEGGRSTGGNWPDRNPNNTMNGAAPRSNQNSRPQFTENRRPESNFRDNNFSGPKNTERHEADPVITEKRRSGTDVSENNGLGPMIAENNVSASKVTAPVAVAGSGHAADDRSFVVAETEKSRHLQSLEKSDKVVSSKINRQQLPIVSQSVSIVHINSPSDFYIQLCDEESKERMNKFLAEFHQSAHALSATPYSNGRVGDCVAGLFDNCWFRAEVVELLPGDRARLFFVDYGNVSVVEYKNIRSTMPKDLLSRPWLAIRCTIEGVVGSGVGGEWSKDAIAWFSQRFENNICTVRAVIPFEGNQPCVVDLVGVQAKESIKEQIISNRFGVIVSRKQAEQTITLEKENKSTFAVTANNADGKALGKVDKVGDDAAGLVKPGILSPTPMPCGAAVKVIHANNPSDFFVQSADEAVQLSIAQVCIDLTAHCSDSTQNSYRPSAVGEYVAALFEGMWFRAQVRKILPQDQFELFFVDFGNCDIIGASNIRVLPAKFVSVMPKQAIGCGIVRLAGTDVAEKWSDESCAWFKGYCENFDFHVQAVVLDDDVKCQIDMLRTGDERSIREQLLSSRRAVELRDQTKLLSDSDRSKETNTLTASSSCDKSASRANAGGVSQSQLSPIERNRGATGATVAQHNQAEIQRTTVISRPTHDANTRNVRSTAQESSSVVSRPTLTAIQSASIATSAASHVSAASNQPTASSDPTKSSVINTKSSVDSSRTAAVKSGSFTINCGDVVTIVHVNSPSDFYVQLQTDSIQREIVELLKKLNEWCTSSASGAKPYRPTGGGEIVAANFEGIWYRAEVLGTCQDSKFELRFIDYGNVDVFNFVDIRRLPAALINILPRQAVPCAISGVKPVEPDGRWSPEAVGWFRENTENVSSFVVRSSSLAPNGTYLLDVYTVLPNGNQELSLCEKLISLKFGRSTDTAASRNSQSSLISDVRSPGQLNDRSVARSSGQSTNRLSEDPLPKDAVGDRIQRETRCNRSVFKFSDLPELRLSSDVTVEVTLPTDPGSFWCQDLMQMADMIKHFQFQESPPPSHPASASSGLPKVVTEKNEVCLGFHDKYGEWYRVVVKDVRQDCLTVRFMDYGDEATVPFDHVRPFPSELRSFPPLAIHCSLAGVAAVGNGWTEQAKAVFHSLVSSQILSASIKSHDSKTDDYKVILKVQSSGQVVGDELVAAGLARHV